MFQPLGHALKENLWLFHLMERCMNQIHPKNAYGFLLQQVRRVAQVDVQKYVVWLATGLELKAQTHPTVRLIGAGKVARRNGVDKGKKSSLRPASFLQLLEQLRPLAVEHRLQAFFGYVADAGAVQIVAHFL